MFFPRIKDNPPPPTQVMQYIKGNHILTYNNNIENQKLHVTNNNYFTMTKFTHKSLQLSLIILLLCFTLSSAHKKNKTKNHNSDDHSDHHSDHGDQSSSNSNTFRSDFKGCFSKVYAFGDLDTDTGNANFLGGGSSPPEGGNNNISIHNSSSSSSMKSSMSGQLVIDYLCESLSIPPLSPYKGKSANFKNGVNFAIAGTTAFSNDFFSRINHTCPFWAKVLTSFQTQIDWFQKYMVDSGCNKGSCQADMDNSLFWLGDMGVSDYVTALGSPVSLLSLTELSSSNQCYLLQTLLSKGAKYIVVQGVPPVGCLPVCMASSLSHDRDHMGCVASVNKAIMLNNQILQTKLEIFRRQYPNCTILYADTWNAYLTVSSNPKKYGIEEPFKACCGCGGGQFNFDKDSPCGSHNTSTCQDPQKYINWDGVHLTGAMYKHITDLFLHQGFCKPSFDELVKHKKSM